MYKRGSRSLSVLVVFCLVCLYAVPAMAEAAEHNNIVVVGGDQALRVGEVGTATVYLTKGEDRCNAGSGKNAVTVALSTSGAAVALVTDSVSLTDCGLANGKQITYKGNAEGVATITGSASGGITNSTYTSGSLTVTVGAVQPPEEPTNTPPTITVPDGLKVEGNTRGGAYVNYLDKISISDAEDSADDLELTCSPASGSKFALGPSVVKCTVTDSGGLTDTGSFTVTVEDTKPPKFIKKPEDISVVATSAAGAEVHWTIKAYDIVDGWVSVDCDRDSGTVFAPGTTRVTCNAKDSSDNEAEPYSFNVTVTFNWSDLLSPIGGTLQTFNRNQTIPVKFQLTGVSAGIADLHATLMFAPVPNGTDYKPATSVGKANDGNIFRYDPTADQYVFNLDAKQLGAGTFRLKVDLGDGEEHTLDIVIK